MLRAMLPTGTAHLTDLPEVAAGSNTFRQRYTIHSNPETVAHRLVTAAVESLLLDWPFQPKKLWYAPLIVMNEDGLQIRLLAAVYDLPALEYLINLGQALVSADPTR
jgi:hypothetical protein